MMEDSEVKIGEKLMAIISAGRALAEESSGVLTEEERGMCLQIATEFSHLLGRKIKESRARLRKTSIDNESKAEVLMPIHAAAMRGSSIKSPIVRQMQAFA